MKAMARTAQTERQWRGWEAWHTAVLGRVKEMPPLSEITGIRPQIKKMPPTDVKAIFAAMREAA